MVLSLLSLLSSLLLLLFVLSLYVAAGGSVRTLQLQTLVIVSIVLIMILLSINISIINTYSNSNSNNHSNSNSNNYSNLNKHRITSSSSFQIRASARFKQAAESQCPHQDLSTEYFRQALALVWHFAVEIHLVSMETIVSSEAPEVRSSSTLSMECGRVRESSKRQTQRTA